MSDKVFKIPEYEYFEMGGNYSGCKRGTNRDDFNFRISPKGAIKIQTWYDVKCFDKSILVNETEFEVTRDGYHAACEWIEKEYHEWEKEHTVRDSALGYFYDGDKE